MNKVGITLVCLGILLLISAGYHYSRKRVEISYPASWPKPQYDFENNPLTQEGIDLGRTLFYEPKLSKDNTISCSSCHLSFTTFTHVDHSLSHGIHDSIGIRNSPVLVNLAWNKSFMWDGAIHHLDVQALAPITHPAEMGESLPTVISKLQQDPTYDSLFFYAYGDTVITGERLLKAISQFQLTLISCNSKYDQVKAGKPGIQFTDQEKHGYDIFLKHCNHCHTEPMFTSGEFENNGLPVDKSLNDMGRMRITLRSEDSLKFKVPTLRNIEFSYPYMHDGRFKTLYEVMNHYQSGIVHTETLSSTLKRGIELTENDKIDLIAFLLTLTDKTFLFNPVFGFPK